MNEPKFKIGDTVKFKDDQAKPETTGMIHSVSFENEDGGNVFRYRVVYSDDSWCYPQEKEIELIESTKTQPTDNHKQTTAEFTHSQVDALRTINKIFCAKDDGTLGLGLFNTDDLVNLAKCFIELENTIKAVREMVKDR